MKPRLKDFPIDHRLMAVADTPKMAALAQKIADLQAEYDKLLDEEQRRQFAAFLHTVRENASERVWHEIAPKGSFNDLQGILKGKTNGVRLSIEEINEATAAGHSEGDYERP